MDIDGDKFPADESLKSKIQEESDKLETKSLEKPPKSFECEICAASFNDNKCLIEHLKAHLDESRMTSEDTAYQLPKFFECDVCYLSFPNEVKLQEHKKIHMEANQDEDINGSPKFFECQICFLSFTEKEQLTEHLKYHAGETPPRKAPSKKAKKLLFCKICDMSFTGKKQLAKHQKVHSVETEVDRKKGDNHKKMFTCKICGLSFSEKKRLKHHKKTHKKHHSAGQSSVKKTEKIFSCDVCDMAFKSKKGKNAHMKVHMEENVNIDEEMEIEGDNFECEICGLSFKSKKFLNEHKRAHAKESRVKKKKPELEEVSNYCKLCQISFTDRDTLTKHLKGHLEESIAMNRAQCLEDKVPTLKYCKICNVPFTDRRFLVEHMKTHLVSESFNSANGNGASVTNKESFGTHAYKHSGILVNSETADKDETPKSFNCEICNESFSEIQELGDHLKVHVKGSKEGGEEGGNIPNTCFCEICNIPFSDYNFLAEHLKLHLAQESSLAESKPADDVQKTFEFVCEVCNAGFAKKNNLTKHLKIHLKEKPYKCEICDIQCTTKSNMTAHMMIHTGEKPYKCTICDAAFSKRCNLVKHHSIHTGEKPYKCYFCEAGFSNRSNMVAHMRLHTGEKPYKCDKCDATFLLESKLIKHQRMHTGERPFKCTVCGAAFIHKSSLNKHMKRQIHNGEHPFKCEYCDLELTSQVRLANHLRTHTEEKKYKCESCHAEFAMKCTLTIHQKIHTGEKPFKCDACDAAFSQRGSLTVHQRIHAGEMPFKCHICDAAYFQKGSLAVHMKLHANLSENHTDDNDFKHFHKRILQEISMVGMEGDSQVKTNIVAKNKVLDSTTNHGLNLSNTEKRRNGDSKEVNEHDRRGIDNSVIIEKMSAHRQETNNEQNVECLLTTKSNSSGNNKHPYVSNQGFDAEVDQHTSYKRRKFEKILKNYFDENLEYGRHQTLNNSSTVELMDQELSKKLNEGSKNCPSEVGSDYTKRLLQKSGLSEDTNNLETFNKHQIDSTVDAEVAFKRGVPGTSITETSDNQVLNMHKNLAFNFDERFNITQAQKLDLHEARKSNIEKYPTYEDKFYSAENQFDYRKIFGNAGYQNGELLDNSKLMSKKNMALNYSEGFYRPENQNIDFYKAVRVPSSTTGYEGGNVTSQYQDVNLGHIQKTASSDCPNVGIDERYNTSLDRNSGFLDNRKLTLENTWAMGYGDKSGFIPHGSLYFDNAQRYNRLNPYENMSLNQYTVNPSEEKLQRTDKNNSDLIQTGARLDTTRPSGDQLQGYMDQYACTNPYGYPLYK